MEPFEMSMSCLRVWVVGMSLTVCAPALAQTEPWSVTFQAERLRPHFAESTRVLVVAGGDVSTAAPAAEAMLAALNEVPVALAMDASSLGDVAALNDREIVQQAGVLPVDEVLVIRVFSGNARGRTVTVVAYDLHGNGVRSFNGREGVPLTDPSTLGSPAVHGPAAEADDEVAASPVDHAAHARAVREYEDRVVGFGTEGVVNGGTQPTLRPHAFPVIGKYQRELSWDEFYAVVGRPDLGAAYRKGVLKKRTVAAFGAISAVTGGVLMGVGTKMGERCVLDHCVPELSPTWLTVGAALTVGGLTAVGIGWKMSRDVVPGHEKRRAAEEYNAALRRELGLADDLSPASRAPRPAVSSRSGRSLKLHLVPTAGRRRAGLRVALQY